MELLFRIISATIIKVNALVWGELIAKCCFKSPLKGFGFSSVSLRCGLWKMDHSQSY